MLLFSSLNLGVLPLNSAYYAEQPSRSFIAFARENMSVQFTSAIDPLEVQPLTIGGQFILPSGITLSAVGTPTITVTRGSDAAAASRFGVPTINSGSITAGSVTIPARTAIQLWCMTPIDAAWYEIRVPCTGSDGATYVLKATLMASSQ